MITTLARPEQPVTLQPATQEAAAIAAERAAYLASIPTEPTPLDPMAALELAAEHYETTAAPQDWRAMVGAYALALWGKTQRYRTRDFEIATEALRGKVPWELIGAIDDAGYDMLYEAVEFGARVGLQLAHGLAPPRQDDAEQAAWLEAAYRSAETAWPELAALRVQGDWMAPDAPDGSTVVVDTTRKARPGDLVVADSPTGTMIGELRADERYQWLVRNVRDVGGIPVAAIHVGGSRTILGAVVGVVDHANGDQVRILRST